MVNLTLSIEDEVLRRARIRAIEAGTSVNAAVREFLESYADAAQQASALDAFLDLAGRSNAGSGEEGRDWTRDDIYADRAPV